MARYLVTLEYEGTGFHGFQKQPGLPTVQGALEDAVLTLTGEEVRSAGAGRTDAGVHAVGQAAAFDLPGRVDIARAEKSLNGLLGGGVAVTEMREVPSGFDPRRDAEWREYRYFVLNRANPSPLLDRFSFHYPAPLDLDTMRSASALAVGEHVFSAFRVKAEEGTARRTILRCKVVSVGDWPGMFCVVVRADSFLYRMMRVMTGALLAVGNGRMGMSEFEAHLEGGEKPCADPLPARGLFLWRVRYPAAKLRAQRGRGD